ncbi:hypothetical protein J437_LFUL015145 [Ladona fulva]|uniref:Uncharacterized protein n=1 Tax=Ladona fulva TaxID=123851 RepID=A0A8K0P5D1_LADFU|nr:hypothetical protein J437_LFUL015145 [Ladona fulva]
MKAPSSSYASRKEALFQRFAESIHVSVDLRHPCAAWTAAPTVAATREAVYVTPAGAARDATFCRATPDAQLTDSARTGRASVPKGGTADTARCVSTLDKTSCAPTATR